MKFKYYSYGEIDQILCSNVSLYADLQLWTTSFISADT